MTTPHKHAALLEATSDYSEDCTSGADYNDSEGSDYDTNAGYSE